MDTADAMKKESQFDVAHHEGKESPGADLADLAELDHLSYGDSGLRAIINSPYVFGAALLASMGGFSFGYDQGVISLILTMDQFQAVFPEVSSSHSGSGFYKGFMTAMLEFGAFLGCLAFPWFADRYSRKWGLSMAVVWFCVGAIIQTAAVDYGMLVAGRTIGGVGVGTLAMGAPLYISEISPPNLRGSLMVLEQLSIVIGAIVAYWMTFGTDSIASDWAFRLPFLLQMLPALMVGIGIHLFPFSPRWLCMRDRADDARAALAKLRRVPESDDRLQLELKGIMTEVRVQRELLHRRHGNVGQFRLEVSSWIDLFKPRYWKRTRVAVAVSFFQQFSGINAFVYYAPILFAALGQGDRMSLILSGMINICQLVGVSIAIYAMERYGRRPTAIWGGIAMGVPHAILAGLVARFSDSWPANPGPAWFCVALVYLYVVAFGLTYGPLGWTLIGEVFPNAVRAKGIGLAVATNWIANFIIGVMVPPMIESIGYGTYIFFACWCFIATVFAYFCIPETAQLTLEQIDGIFKDNSGAEEAAIREEIINEMRR